jgi:hypothetical protein
MVTEDKTINSTLLRYRLGTLLLWLGVFTWLPFIFLRAVGEKPPFLYFLPFHLIGVLGGSRLRAMARRELGVAPPRKSPLLIAGHLMIFLGILVWAPYLYLKLVPGQPVEVMHYLPYHLTGVLGGVALHVLSYLVERHRSGQAQ